MKTEPVSPTLDGQFWPRQVPYEDGRRNPRKHLSHSGSRSPTRNKQTKYYNNKSWVRRASDASEASTLAGSTAGGSASLLDRIGLVAPAADDSPSLLLRLTDPKPPPHSKPSPKRKAEASASPARPAAALSEAENFADRLIQEAMQNGVATKVRPVNGTNGSGSGLRASSPVRLLCSLV